MCILDHVVIFPHVVKYMPQSLVDNFPKVIRQINSAEQNVLLIGSGILRLAANSSQFVNATSQEHRCINSRWKSKDASNNVEPCGEIKYIF